MSTPRPLDTEDAAILREYLVVTAASDAAGAAFREINRQRNIAFEAALDAQTDIFHVEEMLLQRTVHRDGQDRIVLIDGMLIRITIDEGHATVTCEQVERL